MGVDYRPGQNEKRWQTIAADPKKKAAFSAKMSETAKRTNAKSYRCTECGHENNAGNMGKHSRKTGHERKEVMPYVS